MVSSSDPGRNLSAPDPGSGISAPARSRLVVEEYLPPARPARSPGKPQPPYKRNRTDPGSRAWAVLGVVSLHVAIGAWLWTAQSQRWQRNGIAPPLVLLNPIPPSDREAARPDLSPPDLEDYKPQEAPMPRFVSASQPAEIAISISPSTDVMILDADAAEVARTLQTCGVGAVSSPKRIVALFDGTLLVRVEKDGHVSDSKVEVGSGAPRMDDATQHCLLQAQLTPRRIHGEAVVSWQRVRWSSRELQAHS